MQYICTLIIAIGAVFIVLATVKYYKMVKLNKEEIYTPGTTRPLTEKVSMVLMVIFIGGYGVGILDTLIREVEPIYYFVGLIFCLGGIFVYAAIDAQSKMLMQLRGKTREVMKTFVNAIDMKDSYTKGHSQHVFQIVAALYDELPDSFRNTINRTKLLDSAMLHDIGKLSIRDEVLNKAGALDDEEWAAIKTHPANGKKILDDTSFANISDWVLYHHERMDGKGYYKIPGHEVPAEARIITVADMYSALCTDRVYRKKKSHEEALKIMEEVSGTQLDPALMRCFVQINREKLERDAF